MAADGGLYAELIKNRSFEFNSPLMGWGEHTTAPGDGTILVLNQSAENVHNRRYIRLSHYSDNPYGLSNEGFRGMGRLKVFTDAIKTRYADIRLVNSVGPDPLGDKFDFLNDTLRSLHADILDEHYYRKPDWFLQNAARYDHYDRSGPKIFAGEYSAKNTKAGSATGENTWECALAEAIHKLPPTANYISLRAATPGAANSLGNAMAVSPIENTIQCKGKNLTQNIGPNTFCVIRIKI